MKRIMCLIFLFLISCAPVPASLTPVTVSPTPAPTNPPSVPMSSVFTYNQKCPHVCWLGINPGVTTAEEARTILNSSSQIDQTSYISNGEGFRFVWNSRYPLKNRVSIAVKNGIVQDIYIDFYTIVKIQEFIDLIGQPDEISIRKVQVPDARFIDYILYYTSMNALIFVSTNNETGPDIEDSVNFLNLNIAPDDPSLPMWISEQNEFRQPWLGFGHLEEYLKNRPSPSE